MEPRVLTRADRAEARTRASSPHGRGPLRSARVSILRPPRCRASDWALPASGVSHIQRSDRLRSDAPPSPAPIRDVGPEGLRHPALQRGWAPVRARLRLRPRCAGATVRHHREMRADRDTGTRALCAFRSRRCMCLRLRRNGCTARWRAFPCTSNRGVPTCNHLRWNDRDGWAAWMQPGRSLTTDAYLPVRTWKRFRLQASCSGSGRVSILHGEREYKRAPHTRIARGPHPALMGFDNSFHDRQPQS